jgi:hypothetical protein
MRIVAHVAAAVVTMIAACTEKPRPAAETPTAEAHEPAKESSMDDALRSLDRRPEITITVQQGTEHWKQGLITLTVHGGGQAIVEQRRAGETTRREATLAPARIAAIGAALAARRFTAARTTTTPREPGDTPLILRVEGAGGAPFEASLWAADRYQDRDLDAILKLADGVIHEVTGGALGQPAPALAPVP